MSVDRYDFEGTKGQKIRAFALFYDRTYDSQLGVDSLRASADTRQELLDLTEVKSCEEYHSYQIIETSTFEITDAGSYDGPEVIDRVEVS